MSTRPAPPGSVRLGAVSRAGAPGAAIRSGTGRRRPPSDSCDRLRRCSDRLDTLLRDVSVPAYSQGEHDRRVEEAEAIALELRAVFREPARERPVHPPLWHEGGKAAW